MRVRRPFAEYRLTALGHQRSAAPSVGTRVECRDYEQARALLAELELDDPRRLSGLLLEVEPCFGEGPGPGALLDRLARCIDRGLIEVVRVSLLPVSSEMPELFEMPVELEPVENEIDDGFSLLAEATAEPALAVEVLVDVEPAPTLELANDVEQPAPSPES